jgi:chloramphenicol 3-O-phosphotransferase
MGGGEPVESARVPKVIVVTGIMASGKSTVAQLLAEQFPRSVHVRGDWFRRIIINGRAPISPELSDDDRSQLRLRHRLAAHTADAYAQEGFTVVAQDIIIGDLLGEFISAIKSRPLALVVLAPNPDAVRAREAGRPKTGYVGGWTVDELDAAFRATTPRWGLWLDTSHQSPSDTVREVLARLDEAVITP